MTTLRRLTLTAATAAALASSPLAVGTAAAKPPPACSSGNAFWTESSGKAVDVVTHRSGFHMVPHQTRTMSSTAEFRQELHTSASGSASGRLAGSKLSKLLLHIEAEIHGNFATDESSTTHDSVSVTDTVQTRSKDGSYVSFAGYRYYTGWWSTHQCSRDGMSATVVDSGPWTSFDPSIRTGIALCPSTRYKPGTLMAQACAQTWN